VLPVGRNQAFLIFCFFFIKKKEKKKADKTYHPDPPKRREMILHTVKSMQHFSVKRFL